MTATSLLSATQTALRVADEISSAVSRKSPLRIQGAGHWLDAGAPVHADGTISLDADSGILEYVLGDLTVTVLAGTSLDTINATVAEGNQWLALDPFGGGRGSIGATIATASYGPLAQMFGTPRDQLLGVEFVSGVGDIVRGGGKVTKNVAGFDLSRLCCGAWGTLGVLTEVTMRLRALPDRDVTLAVPLPDGGAASVAQMLAHVRAAGLTAAAMELIDPMFCAALSIGLESNSSGALLVRLCGNEDGVAVQMSRMQAAFAVQEYPSSVWQAFTEAEVERGDAMVFRLSSRPSHLPAIWEFARSLAERFAGSRVHASVGRGVVRCIVPSRWQAEIASALVARPDGGIIFEKLPNALWPILAPVEGMSDRLNTRVRDAFDPHRILNRGILGEALP